MNFLSKNSSVLLMVWLFTAHANADTSTLSVLQSLTEQDMRGVAGSVQWKADTQKLDNIQRTGLRNQRELQQKTVHGENSGNVAVLDIPQQQTESGHLPEPLQQHVEHIAQGLQSSDPTQGIHTLLEPIGKGRNDLQINLDNVKIGTVERQLNTDSIIKISQQLQNKLP